MRVPGRSAPPAAVLAAALVLSALFVVGAPPARGQEAEAEAADPAAHSGSEARAESEAPLEGEASVEGEAPPGLGAAAAGWVVDDAGLLPEEVRSELDRRLADHEALTGNQVVVLTVETTGDLPIEDFANRELNRRGIGRRGVDNGVLFVVAYGDRTARIEVGYGLEATLPDLLAGRILRGEAIARFRDGDYAGGIVAATGEILAVLAGERRASFLDRLPLAERVASWIASWPRLDLGDQVFFGFFLFLFGPLLALVAFAWLPWKRVAPALGLALFALVAAVVVWHYPWMLGAPAILAGLVGFAWLDKRSGGKLSRAIHAGGATGSGRSGGSSSRSSSSSSSSSSSRSFSGGGGRSGGGGASASW